MKKWAPYILLAVLLVVGLIVKYSRDGEIGFDEDTFDYPEKQVRTNLDVFRDREAEYFFTKHARCRMKCRSITQREIKEIVRKAKINYNKSDLQDSRGPKYAMEGYTSRDRKHIRVIVAPKQKHLSIVTVIDLDKEWECPSCE
ncbi:MAG: DUF4258 domain-containing protein [Cyclobacteriaceae bacterium]